MLKTVLFDLDGTLTNSLPTLKAIVRQVCDDVGYPVPENENLDFVAGPPFHVSIPRLIPDAAIVSKFPTYADEIYDDYLHATEVYDGVFELLDELFARKIDIGIATYKPRPLALRVVAATGLEKYFGDAVFGADHDSIERQHKTDILAAAMAATGAEPERTVYVGDHHHDEIAAADNRVRFLRHDADNSNWVDLSSEILSLV